MVFIYFVNECILVLVYIWLDSVGGEYIVECAKENKSKYFCVSKNAWLVIHHAAFLTGHYVYPI